MAHWCAGLDEAGRGPLAGPVVAAAVILGPGFQHRARLKDSKRLTSKQREDLFALISAEAQAFGVGLASPEEIDQINILQASLLAMQRACAQLTQIPSEIWVDGPISPASNVFNRPMHALINGDALMAEISAASIIAKVTRDRLMRVYDSQYPVYGFAQHMGYPTKAHMAALHDHGVSPIHRMSFKPVRAQALAALEHA